MNFTHSSRKAWAVIRRLGAANAKQCGKASISADKVASRLVQLTKVNMDKKMMAKIRKKLKGRRKKLAHNVEFSSPFTIDEIVDAISHVKAGKAAGLDYIHPEFILNCGPKAIEWLTRFFNDVLLEKNVPPAFKKSKIIAILKPGKTSDKTENYRPIFFAECCIQTVRARHLQSNKSKDFRKHSGGASWLQTKQKHN